MKKSKIVFASSFVGASIAAICVTLPLMSSLKTSMVSSSSTYTMTFSASENNYQFVESPYGRTYQVTAKNYNDDDITFNYRRITNTNDGWGIMNPDSCFYNVFDESVDNMNGLDGLMSIRVIFTTDTGSLQLSFGLDENYTDTNIELQSGVTYDFGGTYRPSHFMLEASPDQVLESYQVKITSIELTYNSYSYYNLTEDSYTTTNLASNLGRQYIPANSSYTYQLNNSAGYDIGNKNYLIVKYRASTGFKGTLNYINTSNSTSQSDEFYIEPNEEEFRIFLDAFRNSANASCNKKLTSITFYNPSDKDGALYFNELSIANRTYSRTDIKYIADSTIRLGVSLRLGGSVASVQNMNLNVKEYINSNYDLKIRASADVNDTSKKVIATNPNLVNAYDLGREIQQSYYFNVDTANGYTRGEYNGSYISYNPVQAGDKNMNESRIIDYFATSDAIWVKVQACDWAHDNSLTKSYITNTYTIKDGLIYVNNSIINWYGFTNYDLPSSKYASSSEPYSAPQELPAVYVSHALNYFGSVYDDKLIFDPNSGWNTGGTTPVYKAESLSLNSDNTTYSANLGARNYHYEFRNHPENWLGYFNEDKFGLAIYIPANKYNSAYNTNHVFSSGNLYESHNVKSQKYNRTYLDDNYEAKSPSYTSFYYSPKESSKINNTNYLSSTLGFFPSEYVKLSWTYAIGADYINTLRTKFATIQSSQEIYNDFSVWKGSLI